MADTRMTLMELAERVSPEVRERIERGQQFNAYEQAYGDGWFFGIGPITDFFWLGEFKSQEAAELVTETLRPLVRELGFIKPAASLRARAQ